MAEYDALTREEQVRLLQMLRRLTLSGKIEWQRPQNPLRSDRRNTATPDGKYSFTVESIDSDDEPPYELTVYRRVSQNTFAEMANIQMQAIDTGGDDEINSLIADLYSIAHQRQRSEEMIVKNLFDTLTEVERDIRDK